MPNLKETLVGILCLLIIFIVAVPALATIVVMRDLFGIWSMPLDIVFISVYVVVVGRTPVFQKISNKFLE